MNKQRIMGYISVVVGFAMIISNAIGYIFDYEIKSPVFTVLGSVFVLIGMKRVKGGNKGI